MFPPASWVTNPCWPTTSGKVPVTAPVVWSRTTLDEVFCTKLTATEKLAPVPTPNTDVGLPFWGSTDHSSRPPGENLSTLLP
jgi:hypothetical protein